MTTSDDTDHDKYPGLFWDYCQKVEAIAERERKHMERYCNFCGAITDEGCELCARERDHAG